MIDRDEIKALVKGLVDDVVERRIELLLRDNILRPDTAKELLVAIEKHPGVLTQAPPLEVFENLYFDVGDNGVVFVDIEFWYDDRPSDFVLQIVVTAKDDCSPSIAIESFYFR